MDIGVIKTLRDNIGSNRMIVPVTKPTKLNIPTYDGSGQATHPSVVYTPNKFGGYYYWMAFTPYKDSNDDFENPSIVASQDGITWVVPNGLSNPIIPMPTNTNNFNRDVELICLGTQLVMYYSEEHTGTFRITSNDGVSWSEPMPLKHKITNNTLEFGSMTIAYYQDTWGKVNWMLWNPSDGGIERWESEDGILWVPIGAWGGQEFARTNLASKNLWHLSHFEDSEGHHFLTSAFRNGGQMMGYNGYDHGIHYGFSQDGKDIIFEPTPLLHPSNLQNDWLGMVIYRSSMIRIEDNKHRVYFSSQSLEKKWSIGYLDVKLQLPTLSIEGKSSRQIKRELLLDKAQIRDNSQHFVNLGIIDPIASKRYIRTWNYYTNKSLSVRNGLDKDVVIKIMHNFGGSCDASNHLDLSSPTKIAFDQITIPANGEWYPILIDKNTLPMLEGVAFGEIAIMIKATDIPTIGQISIGLTMWN